MARQWLRAWWNSGPTSGGRRQRQRVERYFECDWITAWGEEKTRVSSISPTGCYIDSRLTVPPEGTLLHGISVALPDGQITVDGMVLQATPGVGFAVRFIQVDDDARARLSGLVGARA
jgi:hypothetical protein